MKNKNNKEFRMLNVEFKAIDNDDGKMIIEGYPIVFETPATHWGVTEIISRDALNSCDMTDVPLKYNHDDSHLLMARTRNGSMQLSIDSVGVKMHADLIDTQSNRDIYECIKSGLLDKMSFGFTVKKENYDFDTDTRTILEIDKLYDVSIVDMPFYDSTSVYARNLDNTKDFVNGINKIKERKKLINRINRKEILNRF